MRVAMEYPEVQREQAENGADEGGVEPPVLAERKQQGNAVIHPALRLNRKGAVRSPSRGVVPATRGLDPDLEGSAGGRVVAGDRLDGQPVRAVIYSPLHD